MPKEEPKEIFKVVEIMPLFPGCEYVSQSAKDRDLCSKEKMMEYIFKELKYPAEAKNNKVEGKVVVQFIVAKDGSVSDINVVKDIGHGCGDALKEVIKNMNSMPGKWIPGRQRNRTVDVLLTLPVEFKL